MSSNGKNFECTYCNEIKRFFKMYFCEHKTCEECFCKKFSCPDANCQESQRFRPNNKFLEKILSSPNYQLYLQKSAGEIQEIKKCVSCIAPRLIESECEICLQQFCQKCLDSQKCLACNFTDCNDCYPNHWICNRKKIEKGIMKFYCSMCYESFTLDEMLTFDCNHRFCKNCCYNLCVQSINSNMKVLCPEENCPNLEVDTHIVNSVLEKHTSLIEKYDKFLLDSIMHEDQNKNEKIVFCQECKINFYVPVEALTTECNKCKNLICAQKNCGYEFYKKHKNKSCEELREDRGMKALRNEGKLQRCPECFTYFDKIKSTCNYMRCSSIKCKNKTIFCFLCGEQLIEGKLKNHFLDNNEYAPCLSKRKMKESSGNNNVLEEEKEVFLEKKEENKMKDFTFGEYNRQTLKEKLSSISCFKCAEKNSIQSFEELPLFFKCLSNKCQGVLLNCMVCENNFPEDALQSHLEFESKINVNCNV